MDFYGMKRKQLQALCKKHKLPANLTNLKMAESLASILKATNSQVVEDSGPKPRSCLRDSKEILNRDSGGGTNDGDGGKKVSKKVTFCSGKDQMYEYIDLASDSDEAQSIRKGVQTRRSSRARLEPLKTDTRTEKKGPVENIRSTRSRTRKSVGFPIAVQSPVDTRETKRAADMKMKQVEKENESDKSPPEKIGVCKENEILRRSKRCTPKVHAPLVEIKVEQPGRKNGRLRKMVSEEASAFESEIPEKIQSTGQIEEPRKRSRRNAPKGTVENNASEIRGVVATDESKQSSKPLNNRMAEKAALSPGTGIAKEERSSYEVQDSLRQSDSHAINSSFGVPTAGKIGFIEVEREDGNQNELSSFIDNRIVLRQTDSIPRNEEFLRLSSENIPTSTELAKKNSNLKGLRKSMLGEKHPLSGSKAQDEGSKRSKGDAFEKFCEGRQVYTEGVVALEACLLRRENEVFSAAEQEERLDGIVGLTRSQMSPINTNLKAPSEDVSEDTESIAQLEESPVPTEVSTNKRTLLDGKTGDLVHLGSSISLEMMSISRNEREGERLDESRNCYSNIVGAVKEVTFGDGALQLEISLKDDVVGEISVAKLDESMAKPNRGVLKEGFGELGEVGGSLMKFNEEIQNVLVYSHADASNTKPRLEDDEMSTGQNEVKTTESSLSVRMEHREERVEQGIEDNHVESLRIILFNTCRSVDKSNRVVNEDQSSRVRQESHEIHMELLLDSYTSFDNRNRVVDKDHNSVKPNKIIDTIGFGSNESNEIENGSVEDSVVCESVSMSTEGLVIQENNMDSEGESILEGTSLNLDDNLCEKEEEHHSASIQRLEQNDNILVKEITCNSAVFAVATKHPLTQTVADNEERSITNDLKPISHCSLVLEETTVKAEADCQVTFPTVGETKELTQTVSKEPLDMSTEENEYSNRSYISSLRSDVQVDIEQSTWLEEDKQHESSRISGFPGSPETQPGFGNESEDLNVVLHGQKEHLKTQIDDKHLAGCDEENMVFNESGRTASADEGSQYCIGKQLLSVEPNEEGEISLDHQNEPSLHLEEEEVSLRNNAEPTIFEGNISLKEASEGYMKTGMMMNCKLDHVSTKKDAQQQELKTDSQGFKEADQILEDQESVIVCGDILALNSTFQFCEGKLTETDQCQFHSNECIHELGGKKYDAYKVCHVEMRPEVEVNEQSPETPAAKVTTENLENVENKMESEVACTRQKPLDDENTVGDIGEHILKVQSSLFAPGMHCHCSKTDTSNNLLLEHNSLGKGERDTEHFLKKEIMIDSMSLFVGNNHQEELNVEILDTIPGENRVESNNFLDVISSKPQYKDAHDSTQPVDVKSKKQDLDSVGHEVTSELHCTAGIFSAEEYNCHDIKKASEIVMNEGSTHRSDCYITEAEENGNEKIVRRGICCASGFFFEHPHEEYEETFGVEYTGPFAPQESTDIGHRQVRQEVFLVDKEAFCDEEIESAKIAALDFECDNCKEVIKRLSTETDSGNDAHMEIPAHEETVVRDSSEESFSKGEKEEAMVNGISPFHSDFVFIIEGFTEPELDENESVACFVETDYLIRKQGCSESGKALLDCNLSTLGVSEKRKGSDDFKQAQALHEGLENEENEEPKEAAIEEMEDHQVNQDGRVVCPGEDGVVDYYTVAGEMALVYKDDADNNYAKRKGNFATCELDHDIAVEDASEEVLCNGISVLLEEENINEGKEDNVCVDPEELGNGPVTASTADQCDLRNPECNLSEEQDEEDDTLSSIHALFTSGETQNHETSTSLLTLHSEASANSEHQLVEASLLHQLPYESLQVTKKGCGKVGNKPLKLVENSKKPCTITNEMKENTPAVKKERSNNPKLEKFTAPSLRRPLEDLQSRK